MEIKRNINYKDICKKLVNKDLTSLSKAITLIESNNKNDRLLANKILSELQNKNEKNTLRIGVTGVPGAGKSTFIENFGSNLTYLGKKVAVLTIDPSSSISKGSILGDKTRMEKLSQNKNVFIRPTAASNFQGGVAKNTRESIFLFAKESIKSISGYTNLFFYANLQVMISSLLKLSGLGKMKLVCLRWLTFFYYLK